MSDKPKPDGGHGQDPMQNLWMAMTGATVGGHHEDPPGIDRHAVTVGHEPDKFDARTIVYVPILVTIVLVLTYLLVQGAFAFVNGRESRQVGEDYNPRAARIATTDAKPLPAAEPGAKPLPGVAQPRLEYQRQVEKTRPDANGTAVTDPIFVRSFKPTPTGNSPEIYPEDLRPEHFIDPTTKAKALVEPNWAVKDKVAVIPIDEAIHLMASDAKFKLKVAEKATPPAPGTIGRAKISTGGQTPPEPKKGEPKKDDEHKH